MSAAARVGGYFAQAMARAGGTELANGVARVIGQLVGLGDQGHGVHVSTKAIAVACFDRGVTSDAWTGSEHEPSSGIITDVLDALRGIGVLTWDKAYSTRWHGPDEIPPDGIRVERRGNDWRFPPRRLCLVGHAYVIAAATALRAIPIDAVRKSAANFTAAADAVRRVVRTPRAVPRESYPAELPIGSAPDAASRPPPVPDEDRDRLAATLRAWRESN